MSDTSTATTLKDCDAYPKPGAANPAKRVNYTNGMILGVDDFTQEAGYLLARDRWLAREAIGYGTLSGLEVSIRDDPERGPGVKVSTGVALTPTGHLVEVTQDQCAYLNSWLNEPGSSWEASESGQVSLFVVLRYGECLTDDQPVPGEPCRTQDVYSAPSRITDDFALELQASPPGQVEEGAVRAFVTWLDAIAIADVPHSDEVLADFQSRIRIFAAAVDPLPDEVRFAPVPDWGTVPPPADLVIPASEAIAYLRAAFLVWSTEFRPRVWEETRRRSSTPPTEENVLLAELAFEIVEGVDAAGEQVVTVDPEREIAISERDRPFLLHLRMVQEWLLTRGGPGGPVAPAPGGFVLGDAVASETAFGAAASAGASTQASRADHTHGTPADPIPAHQADANAHTLAGDVTGPVGTTKVVALQGRAMVTAAPAEGDVLTFSGGSWRPATATVPPATGPFVERAEPDRGYRIVAAGAIEFSFADGSLGVVGPADTLYNNLKPMVIDPDVFSLSFQFDGYQPPDFGNPDGHRYVVKATPWFTFTDSLTSIGSAGLPGAFQHFGVGVVDFGDGIVLGVFRAGDERDVRGRIMIEVSQYNLT